jgi:hypothetical protein
MKKSAILLLSFLLVLSIYSCRKKGNPYAGLPTSILGDTTTISFSETAFEFDTIDQGDSVVHIFKIKNTGERDLIIGNAFGSCGCTVPEYPKDPIAPGKEADVRVRFNSEGKEGAQTKSVTLQVNTQKHQEQIFLNGYVRVPKTKE